MNITIGRLLRLFLLIAMVWATISLSAQEQLFHPFIKNYSYHDYKAGTSNWSVIEDDRGIIYVANREGILEYDGKNWTLIESPEQEVARSLAKDDNGVIYAGFVGDIGYLAPDDLGQIEFVSLKNKIPEENRLFKEVWRTFWLNGIVYFQTSEYIFQWNGEEIEVLQADQKFNGSAIIRGELYVGIWEKGLCKLKGDTFELIPDGEKYADIRMYAILPFGHDSMLVGTSSTGFSVHDGSQFSPFPTEIDEKIKGQLYSPCLTLDDDRIVINTLDHGVYILDQNGEVIENFNKETGLQDDVVDYVYVDSRGTLWMALFNGISRVNLGSEFTYLQEGSGLPSNTINDCVRHNGLFYVGTVNGVYYYDDDTQLFQIVEGTRGQVYQLLKHGSRLYAASNRMGIFRIIGKEIKYVRRNVNNDFQIGMMRFSTVDSNRLYIGRRPGLTSLYFDEELNELKEESYTDIITPKYPGFEMDNEGNLWTLGRNKGTLEHLIPHIENGRLDLEKSEFVCHNLSNGLPYSIHAIMKSSETLDFLGDGFLGFDNEKNSFYEKEIFYSDLYKPGAQYFSFPKEDHLGRIWIQSGLGIGVHIQGSPEGKTLISKPFKEIGQIPIWSFLIESMNNTDQTISWLSGPEGMVRHVGNIEKEVKHSFDVLIREIKIGENDIFYGGASTIPENLEIDYQNNTVNFTYAAPFFIQEENILYQTFLEGLDHDWSDKTTTAHQTYMNLPAGKYTFRVKAWNVYNDQAEEATYGFVINPSIWRTWWMYVLYIIGSVLLMGAIVKWRTIKFKRHEIELEQTIKERTLQVVEERNKAEKLYQYQSTLLSEVHHRIKNNLQLIISLLTLQKAKLGKEFDPKVLDTLSHRINSISLIHEQLYNIKEYDKVDTRLYIEKLLEHMKTLIADQNVQVEFEVGDIHFNLETITPLGLIWSELISNSLKYNMDKEDLKLFFKLEKRKDVYFMHFHDNGKGYPNGKLESNKSGMGNVIIHSLSRQLFATIHSYNSDGAHFTMEFKEKQISPLD